MLKKLASVVMKNTGGEYETALGRFSSASGDIRLLNVTAGAGGKSYMNFSKVPTKLAEFCDAVNLRRKAIKKGDVLGAYNLSFDAHFHLVTIHPWADGNGRMSRLLMNQLQFEFGVIPTKIDKGDKAKYIETLIATRECENIELFRNFMMDEHIGNLEQIILQYKTSISGGDVPVNVPVKLSLRQHKIIEMIKGNPSATIREFADVVGVSEKTIKRDIALLKELGQVVRIGSDKSGKWVVR